MSENESEKKSEMPEVIQLSKKTAMSESTQAAVERDTAEEEPRSLTPVFNALVREWRAEGRDIPLRHNPAATTLARGAA